MCPNLSRIEKQLSVILGFTVNLDTPKSRLEKILKSIIDGTEYTAPPLSRLEEDFLKFMDKTGTITDNNMTVFGIELLNTKLSEEDFTQIVSASFAVNPGAMPRKRE